MIFSAAVLSVLLLPVALARPRPDVSNPTVDLESFKTTSNSGPAQALEAAFRNLRSSNSSEVSAAAVVATRNELIESRCDDVIVIFARGTTELGNVGDGVGPAFFDALVALEPGRVIIQGVNDYPADIWGYLGGGSDSGAKDMANSVQRAATQCPTSKIVLSGFSQGAQVTHKAAKLISTALYPKVAAIVLFGDPKNGDAFPGSLNANVKTFCRHGDLICDGLPIPTDAHSHYEDDGPEAAAYVAARV
ncbi:cutinase-domain-containing protein [Choiromyces venosus 120613-1]|uniref:cutinase n=1 Tax=Choiromyces venosus 120613-1 TaxID=1336337 RepID=A0A3N4K988_9PEZI|nr:cutinase-domain-containing protein [Choiromyces venosus 120613-1]